MEIYREINMMIKYINGIYSSTFKEVRKVNFFGENKNKENRAFLKGQQKFMEYYDINI